MNTPTIFMSVIRQDNKVKAHRAPLTLAIILDVKAMIRDADMKVDEYREVLNKYLSEPKHIEPGHAGVVKLNRWLNPSSSGWQEPRAEIILAMQKTLKDLTQLNVDNNLPQSEDSLVND